MDVLSVFVVTVLVGLVPAAIARSKGYNFLLWWLYGAALFIVALPHALLLKSTAAQQDEPTPQQPTAAGVRAMRPDAETSNRPGARKGPRAGASHVFVSFAHEDRAAALKILEQLERARLRCWISTRDVPRGGDFQDAIVDALEQASAMVLVFSQNADNSNEIKKEVALASHAGVLILPVRIENVEPTKGFRYQFVTRNYIDLFEDHDQNMKLMIEVLRKHQQAPA
jgi:hypothetical protein